MGRRNSRRRISRGGDGTGPLGLGSGTGRGLGPCVQGPGVLSPGAIIERSDFDITSPPVPAQVGIGRGLGRGRGDIELDYCTSCGYSESHQRGVPATTKQCPDCGSVMNGGSGCLFAASELRRIARLLL